MPSIGFLVIATGKYTIFVPPLAESLEKFFLPEMDRTIHLFTDCPPSFIKGTEVHHIPHEPWPLPTLKRYHHFDDAKDALARHDFLFYLDADMRVVAPIGAEILPPSRQDLVAVTHPGCAIKHLEPINRFHCGLRNWGLPHLKKSAHPRGEYEANPISRAYVAPHEGDTYFCGGVNGGRSHAFLAMAKTIRQWVDDDLANGITAKWHDESHLNRYLINHPPKVMDAGYCYPESWELPYEKKILALDKNHGEMRKMPLD